MTESPNYQIVHEFENAYVVERSSGMKYPLGDHYGDPVCALIAPDESWFLAAEEGVTMRDRQNGYCEFLRVAPEIEFVHAVRLREDGKVLVLADPWSERPAVWLLDPGTKQIGKLRDGPDLRGEAYREDVEF